MLTCGGKYRHVYDIYIYIYIYSVFRFNGYIESLVLGTDNTDNYVQAAYVAQRTRELVLETQTSAN